MIGRSLIPMLTSNEQGITSFARTEVYSCRERHSSSRWNNLTYPQRCIRTQNHLLIRNFKPERWPAGSPQKFDSKEELGSEHGGYHDIDACPSLTFLIKNRDNPGVANYFQWSVGLRPEIELYDTNKDPGCLKNLAHLSATTAIRSELEKKLNQFLAETGEPRLHGKGQIWEDYIRYSSIRSFPKPAWADEEKK